MSNLSSLIFDGVFGRFPQTARDLRRLRLGWAPPLLWRADSEWRGLRVEVPWLTKPPSEYVADHVRFLVDGACELGPHAWSVGAMLPESSLLYGSDRPFADGDAARVLDGAPDRLRGLIAAENARQTLGLRVGTVTPVGKGDR